MSDHSTMSVYEDPTLYLYTSLTAGSSHIITATSRMETILKANRIPFKAIDCATDEKARMIWGRRSKGRKLPGLVKYGSIIGDLVAIEEWNEYGELHEQIESASGFESLVESSSRPAVNIPAPKPDGPSRSASESRHISISEPQGRKNSTDVQSSSISKPESPLSMAMRQASAEAAAKAGQKKSVPGSAGQKTTATLADTAPVVPHVVMDPSAEDPGHITEMTDAKTPEQLASQGASRTSVDKIHPSPEPKPTSSDTLEPVPSREEQLLQMRRASSTAKVHSKLSEATPAEETSDPIADTEASKSESTDQLESKRKSLTTTTSVSGDDVVSTPLRQHRGSSVTDASREEIAAAEARNMIQEEDEDTTSVKSLTGLAQDPQNEEAVVTSPTSDPKVPEIEGGSSVASKISATAENEEKATKSVDPQDTKPKDAEAAGMSVGD